MHINIIKHTITNALFTVFMYPITGLGQGYKIEGKIPGLPIGEKICLVHTLHGLMDTVSTTTISPGGEFKFEGKLSVEGEWHYVKLEGVKDYIRIFLDNSNITIKGNMADWPNFLTNGSRSQDDYRSFISTAVPLRDELDMLLKASKTLIDSNSINNNNDSIAIVQQQIKKEWDKFIDSHPESMYTAFLILQANMSTEEKRQAFEKLEETAKNSFYGRELKRKLLYTEGYSQIKVGEIAPNFKSLSPEGNVISLKEIASKGKVTLVDFWASWCVPCREETPELKKIYDQLHDKGFNILSISLDHSKTQWIKAIAKDEMNWFNVCQVKGREEDAARIFGVNGIPAQFIVDHNMRILAIHLPGSPIPSSNNLRGQERLDILAKALSQ